MSIIGQNILAGASGAAAYTIDQSVRIGATNKLQKALSGDGNKTTWTWSCWTKNAFDWSINADNSLFSAMHPSGAGSGRFNAYFRGQLPDNYFEVSQYAGSYSTQLALNWDFRDPAAWINIVIVWDTDNGTEADRLRYYINGVRATDFGTANYPSSGEASYVNDDAFAQTIGAVDGDTATSITSYLAEVHFIDGQALDASSFGELNADTNQWVPIKYAGTYGTKGYYMTFEDSAALGDDTSGNGNDYTSTGLVATDQVPDSPTNNFATLNPLDNYYFASTFSEGNLKLAMASGPYAFNTSTIGMTSGKWYWENYFVSNSNAGYVSCGVASVVAASAGDNLGNASTSWGWLGQNGVVYNDGAGVAGSPFGTYGDGDIVGIALDLDNNNLYFSKNNTWENSGVPTSGATGTGAVPVTALSGGDAYYAGLGDQGNSNGPTALINLGQDSSFAGAKTAQNNSDVNAIGDFYYTPPTGYLTLCTSNLPDPSIELPGEHVNTVLYTGDAASSNAITGVGFQPDLVWLKKRVSTDQHVLTDVVRGATKYMASDSNIAEVTQADALKSFDSDGFTVGAWGDVNGNTDTMASWNWKAGGTGVANTDGSINSTVSANTTAGFSIVKFEGTQATATIGHGLAQAPNLVIIKRMESAANWAVGGDLLNTWQAYMHLDQNIAQSGSGAGIYFNDTAPTASVFSVGSSNITNNSGEDMLAYCFTNIEGYSKIGTYTGNGDADGTFVYTGFRPAYFMTKSTNLASEWFIYDDTRPGYNVTNLSLKADVTSGEESTYLLDLVSNGVKLRIADSTINNGAYMYIAFAEFPFKRANAR